MTTPSELRGLSERATPGEWFSGQHSMSVWKILCRVGLSKKYRCIANVGATRAYLSAELDAEHAANAEFAAACVNEIRRQLSEGEEVRRDAVYHALTFDSLAVYSALSERAKKRTNADNVADTLDALYRAAKAALSAQHQGERSE